MGNFVKIDDSKKLILVPFSGECNPIKSKFPKYCFAAGLRAHRLLQLMNRKKVNFQPVSQEVRDQGLRIPRNEEYLVYAAVTRDEA
jgi:hypothetical protein